MKIHLTIFFFLVVIGSLSAQERLKPFVVSDSLENTTDTVYRSVTKPAEIPQGLQKLYQEYLSFLKIPPFEEKSVRVIVQFIIEKDGKLSDITILRDPGYTLAEQTIDFFQQTTPWRPAERNQEIVRSYFTLPITIQRPHFH